MKNNKLLSLFNDLFHSPGYLIAFLLFSYSFGNSQIIFPNPGFENDDICDPDDCTETDIECIKGWWNHYSPSDLDEDAWIYYDDYFLCSESDLSLTSCGEERGIRINSGTGSVGILTPTTNNPFFGLSENGSFVISFQLNIIDKNSGGAKIQVFVDDYTTDQNPDTDIFIGEVVGFPDEDVCYDSKIAVIDPAFIHELISHEYIFFKVIGTGLSPTTLDVDAVLDNLSACQLVKFEFSTSICNQFCVNFSSDCDLECDEIRYEDPEKDDCYMEVVWYPNANYENEEIINDCYFSYIGDGQCCIESPEPGNYYPIISLYYAAAEGGPANYYPVVEYQDCSTEIVSTDATWTNSNISETARFDLITVNSGVTLTITSDLTLRFCEGGKLVINPGGTVMLYGTLTADCADGWTGVEVQGNGSTNQIPVLGHYPQGRLQCFPGSKIQLALTAARLFGPDYEDTGGIIEANGASFINNRCGIYFAPFNNYLVNPGKPRPYFSSIRNCTFDIIEELPMPSPFYLPYQYVQSVWN